MEVYLLEQGYKAWDTVQNGFTPTANEEGKKNLVNDGKAKNIIISGLIESTYHKVFVGLCYILSTTSPCS